jgi:hypothetical protein
LDPRWRPLVERAVIRYEEGDLSGSDPLLKKEAEALAANVREAVD